MGDISVEARMAAKWPDWSHRDAAKELRRDLGLALRNVRYLPSMFGTWTWLLWGRWQPSAASPSVGALCWQFWGNQPPHSEIRFFQYRREYFELVALTLWTLVPSAFFVVLLVVALAVQSLAARAPNSPFRAPLSYPLAATIWLLRRFLSLSPFALAHDGLFPYKIIVNRTPANDEVLFYINGVAERGSMITNTGLVLFQHSGRLVNLLVNPSFGFGPDLLECVLGRSLDVDSAPVDGIVARVRSQLSKGRRVILLAHSQGGIIVSNVVARLISEVSELETLRRLEVYTFASAADVSPGIVVGGEVVPHTEHFATEDDFVARVGVLTFGGQLGAKSSGWNGSVYMLPSSAPGNGHLMKEHLLPAIVSRSTFARTSRLWSNLLSPTARIPCTFLLEDA